MAEDTKGNGEYDRTLGRIEATVTGTAEDVRMLRTEVGEVVRRVTASEQEIVGVKSRLSEVEKQVHKSGNFIMAFDAQLNQVTGGFKIVRWVMGVVGAVFLAAFVIIGNQVWNDHRTVSQLGTRSVERAENQQDRQQERDDRYADRKQERVEDAKR